MQYLPANFATFGALIYTLFYILLEPVAGSILAPFLISGAAFANYLSSKYGITAAYWAGGLQIAAWIAQFVGHGVFEKRAPALLDNLVQALLLAPLFVWMEVLFHFDYRPELQVRLHKRMEEEIAKFHAQGQKSSSSSNDNNKNTNGKVDK